MRQETNMREAILHIGHGKTGTSYIQSVLSLNVDKLKEAGLLYPYDSSFELAQLGQITSGNGECLFDKSFRFSSDYKTIISAEHLSRRLLLNDNLVTLVLNKVDKLKIILYTRDIMEMLSSAWGQFVKGAKQQKSFEDFALHNKSPFHLRVLKWIDLSKRHEFDIIIRNYSLHRADIFKDFIGVLAQSSGANIADPDTFQRPDNAIVNRSMTNAEYLLLRVLGQLDKNLSHRVGRALANFAPDILSDTPKLSMDAFDKLQKKYTPLLEEINKNLPESEKLRFGQPDVFVENEREKYTLNDQQMQIIHEQIISNFLSDAHVNHISQSTINIASKIERGEGLGMTDALELMKIAQLLNPDGILINRKINEWSDSLGNHGSEQTVR